jgi:Zn-dependent protease
MFLSLFQENPAFAVAVLMGFVVGIVLHEAAHAYSAYLLGDDTAYRAGRVTLNPASHLDVLGSLMLLIAGFGWGKPTPVVPSKLRGGVLGPVAVAFAGPASNLLIIAACALLYALPYFQEGYLEIIVIALAFVNALLFVFNLIPIPPLDGPCTAHVPAHAPLPPFLHTAGGAAHTYRVRASDVMRSLRE